MSCDALVLSAIRGLTPYQTGKPIDELQRELGLTKISKLASNENPLGCSFDVVNACREQLETMARYPDGAGFALKHAISQHYSIDANGLVLGNGSNDVLELIGRTFAGAGDEVIFSQYGFAVYAITAQAIGATAVQVAAHHFAHDLSAIAAAVTDKTKLIFLANPNNPTGTCFGQVEWDAFMSQVPKRVMVVLDEAYTEYVTQADYADGLRELRKYHNLIVTRTFSKAYGLAGFRLGFAASTPEVAAYINRVRQPFNVNTLAMVAGIAALQDQEHVQESVAVNRKGMTIWQHALSSMALSWIPSQGNFLCVNMGQPAQPLYEALLKEGVIVRPLVAYGLANHLRISIGTDEENIHAIEALAKVLDK